MHFEEVSFAATDAVTVVKFPSMQLLPDVTIVKGEPLSAVSCSWETTTERFPCRFTQPDAFTEPNELTFEIVIGRF